MPGAHGGEVQLDGEAVGIAHENLHRAVARHDRLAKRQPAVGQRAARGVEIVRLEGHVIDVARAVVVRLSLGPLHQVQHRDDRRDTASSRATANGGQSPARRPEPLVERLGPLDVGATAC